MKHKKTLIGSLAAVAVVGVGGLTLVQPSTPDNQQAIDAKSYFTNYDEDRETDAMSSGAVNFSSEPGFQNDSGKGSRYPSSQVPGPIPGKPGPGPTYPSPGDNNNFEDYGVSDFVNTSEDNESTFALDVDTGSLAIALELAKQGYRIPPESVRSEEWINGFAYGDRNETDKALAVTAEAGYDSLNAGKSLVRVNVAGQQAEASNKNLNITLVVDTSGSMDIQDRLGLVKASVALLAKNLAPESTISIVTFEDEAGVILEPTKIKDTEEILEAIDEIQPGGSTNLEAGLQEGYRQASKVFDKGENNIVLLASDGGANVGNVTADAIEDNGKKGIHLVTVGYGMGGYNDVLMEQLADQGDGFYSYLNSYEDTEAFFTEEINKVTAPIAMDAKTQVIFDEAVVESYRLIGYDNREIADEDFDKNVDAGEFGAGHNATALYEVVLKPGITSDTLGEAKVRWTNVDNGASEEITTMIELSEEVSEKMAFTDLVADVAEFVKLGEGWNTGQAEALKARVREVSKTYPEAAVLEDVLNVREPREPNYYE